MVRVRHERPDPATSLEVKVPMQIALGSGKRVAVSALSLDGIRLAESVEISPVRGDLFVPFQGFDVLIPVTFASSYGESFLWFSRLPARSRSMIDLFHGSILRGEMVAGEDVVSRLDAPVDLIPMEETQEEKKKATAGKSARWMRIAWQVAFYLLLASAVFLTIGSRAWDRLNFVPAEFAQIAAPIVGHVATIDGFVSKIEVEIGQEVREGDLLIRMSNPDAESSIEWTNDLIEIALARLTRTQRSLERLDLEAAHDRKPFEAALEYAVAQRRPRDFFAGHNLGAVASSLAAMTEFDADPWVNDPVRRRLQTDLLDLRQELIAEMAALRRDLATSRGRAGSADIIAAKSGIVHNLTVQPGQFMIRGMPVAEIEIDQPRFVQAQVNFELADSLFVGMDASFTVGTPEGARTYEGKITSFGAIDGLDPSERRGAPVQIQANNLTTRTSRQWLVPGTPVNAHANRRLGRSLKQKVLGLVGRD